MKIFTYYSPALGGQKPLIEFWKKSWLKHGWEPVVLGMRDAQIHPRYAEMLALISKFPTLNGAAYEQACWLRWLAFDVVSGGVTCDYDVINRGLRPMDMTYGSDVFVHDLTCVPCCVAATHDGASQIVRDILGFDHPHDGKHYSDMLFFKAKGYPHSGDRCREYGSKDWRRYPLTHFAHGACNLHGGGRPRHAVIKQEGR